MAQDMQSQAPSTSTDDAVSPPTAAKPLRRACDCCRKRKVKCDGHDPCSPCKKASIRCAYLQPPKKKGPKGLRSARVLHALRRIDDSASGTPTSPLSPDQNGQFGGWSWAPQAHTQPPSSMPYQDYQVPPPSGFPNGMPTSMPQQQSAYVHPSEHATLHTTTQPPFPPQQYPSTANYHQEPGQSWPHPAPMSAASETVPSIPSPSSSDRLFQPSRISSEAFLPYVQLFFAHMFPIMPIIDRNVYLDPHLFAHSATLSPEIYCFLCALCATTIIQLDASIPTPPPLRPGKATDDVFAEECIRERRDYDYMNASTLSVMTSFFLFCYHGNHERHERAWYYLQESITFAENLSLDDEEAYMKLDTTEAQWRRRLYWLLFITERAYAVQRRKRTRLTPSVTLPSVFESEDQQLLNGFVNLANLFSAVDDSFVSAWRGSRRQSLCNEAWLTKTQQQLDATARVMTNLTETQHLDISVTREWLHVLAWQMGVSNGLIWGQGEGGMRLDYPIELAKKVVEITSSATSAALDSHGIGMEQKLSDIAGCLADVLKCTAGDTSATFLEGKQYLSILLNQLSTIRGKQSRYLRPLMAKMDGLVGFELNQSLPLPDDLPNLGNGIPLGAPGGYPMGARGLSVSQNGMEMLRSLSLSGGLVLQQPDAEAMWERRPSGRVYSEEETSWMMDQRVA
ncbi:hypothetical protein WHR41_08460 [Cladosporium halotolerans]|uniref:Zn(2)-C6 fungal-type domain-containing protein n=1 Tax=Cladosporium halotolerans TaxID=1052096 RepID=A0AB34KII5_9PEZI